MLPASFELLASLQLLALLGCWLHCGCWHAAVASFPAFIEVPAVLISLLYQESQPLLAFLQRHGIQAFANIDTIAGVPPGASALAVVGFYDVAGIPAVAGVPDVLCLPGVARILSVSSTSVVYGVPFGASTL